MTPPPLEYKAIAEQWLLGSVELLDDRLRRAKADAFARTQEVVG